MVDPLLTTLQQHFGFDSLRPGQREVLDRLMVGRSAAAIFPTGSGKSLCYQLPALMLPGLTVVVSPLIALMKDQIDMLTARNIAARRLDSTLSLDEHREVMALIRDGQLRLLYVAPERFNNERFREAILGVPVALFAVDEAHCISEWGHNFRPDYLKLAEFARQCRAERILALTATATAAVQQDIARGFDIAPDDVVRTGFYRSNLTLLTTPTQPSERDARLIQALRERSRGATIVYVTLQKTAEAVAERLTAAGFPAAAYHAGMQDDARARVQQTFQEQGGIVVATIAFGMGIDKADIRYVYHYNLPKSLENYSQEIGRAGRDGQSSVCELFACPADLNALENFAFGDTPTRRAVEDFLADIATRGVEFDVSFAQLAGQHDIRTLVVRTLLTQLELGGYLQGGTPFYTDYKFKYLAAEEQILSGFDPRRQEFLRRIFRHAQGKRTWTYLDVDACARQLNEDRLRIVRALDYLNDQGLLEVVAAGTRHRYRALQPNQDLRTLAEPLHERMRQHEAREIERLHQVVKLIEHDGCQVAALSGYFNEPFTRHCGHCSWCLNGQQVVRLPPRPRPSIDAGVIQEAAHLRAEYPDQLAEPEALARLLCGISSPRLQKARLARHRLFGSLEQVPFQDVLRAVQKL